MGDKKVEDPLVPGLGLGMMSVEASPSCKRFERLVQRQKDSLLRSQKCG